MNCSSNVLFWIEKDDRITVCNENPDHDLSLVGDDGITLYLEKMGEVGIFIGNDQDIAAMHLFHCEQQMGWHIEGSGEG